MFVKVAPANPMERPTISIFKLEKVDSMDAVEKKEPAYATEDKVTQLEDKIKELEAKVNESIFRKPNRKVWNDKRESSGSNTESK